MTRHFDIREFSPFVNMRLSPHGGWTLNTYIQLCLSIHIIISYGVFLEYLINPHCVSDTVDLESPRQVLFYSFSVKLSISMFGATWLNVGKCVYVFVCRSM